MTTTTTATITSTTTLAEERDLVRAILRAHGVNFALDACESEACYESLFALYVDLMPYGTAKARTGDPCEWILARLEALGDCDAPSKCPDCGFYPGARGCACDDWSDDDA